MSPVPPWAVRNWGLVRKEGSLKVWPRRCMFLPGSSQGSLLPWHEQLSSARPFHIIQLWTETSKINLFSFKLCMLVLWALAHKFNLFLRIGCNSNCLYTAFKVSLPYTGRSQTLAQDFSALYRKGCCNVPSSTLEVLSLYLKPSGSISGQHSGHNSNTLVLS